MGEWFDLANTRKILQTEDTAGSYLIVNANFSDTCWEENSLAGFRGVKFIDKFHRNYVGWMVLDV